MNALYLCNEPLVDFSGVSRKIIAQVNALKYYGLKVNLAYLKANKNYKFEGWFIDGETFERFSTNTFISKLQRRCNYRRLRVHIINNNIKLVYIRYIHFANPFFISFLKRLNKKGIKVLMEIPTYPYDEEYKSANFSSWVAFSVEKIYRKKFKKYVNRILTLSDDNDIFGVPAIQINNGIDIHSINLIQKRKPDNAIHMAGVANLSFWHGYDRIIEGLYQYYQHKRPEEKKVFFHIIGDSSSNESNRYRELVKEYRLTDYIKFHGRKFGKDLDSLFNKMDIAVGSLGGHRKNIKFDKSLKNREYCARGIPFFYSLVDPDFEGQDFIYKVPSNDDPIDISSIIEFIDNLNYDPTRIRNFAEENLTWEQQFKKILSEIKY
jgi:glycosyltransferase involved in cell wall biosynthesis